MPVEPLIPVLPPQDLLPKFEQPMNVPQFPSFSQPAAKPVQPVQVQPQLSRQVVLPVQTTGSVGGCVDSAPECELITLEMCQQFELQTNSLYYPDESVLKQSHQTSK